MINTEARPTPANRICKYHLACDMFYLFKKKKTPTQTHAQNFGFGTDMGRCLRLCSFPSRTTCSSRSSTPSRPSSWTRSTRSVVGFPKSSLSRSKRQWGRCLRTKWSATSGHINNWWRKWVSLWILCHLRSNWWLCICSVQRMTLSGIRVSWTLWASGDE